MVHQVSNHKDLPAAATHASQSGPQHAVDKKAEAQRPEPETSTTEVKGEVKGKDLEQALSRVREVFQKADSRLEFSVCLLYTSPSPRDRTRSRMPSSA